MVHDGSDSPAYDAGRAMRRDVSTSQDETFSRRSRCPRCGALPTDPCQEKVAAGQLKMLDLAHKVRFDRARQGW